VRFLLVLLTLVAFVDNAYAATLSENEKIEYLIKSVEEMPARFIRNGTAYDAKQAADHLRLKWHNAGNRIKTAGDFITYCGSWSYMSGEKYKIKFPDGREVESELYLHEQLKELEAVSE